MRRYPALIQDEQKACGVFCIAMILKYYGYKEEIKEIKKRTRLNRNGVSIYGMIQCLRSYNIETNAYEISLQQLKQNFKYPCILFMENKGIGHYVVLYEIKENEYIVGDPAIGLVSYDNEKMSHYTSRCIMIHHVGNVDTKKRMTYISFLKNLYFTYKSMLKSILIKGLVISVLGYISSLFFKYVIDYINFDSSFFVIGSLIVAYGMCEIIKVLFYYFKSSCMSELHMYLDEDLVGKSVLNLIYKDLNNDDNEGYRQSELLSLFELTEMSLALLENIFIDGICLVVFVMIMFFINAYMSLSVIFMGICMFMCSSNILKRMKKKQKDYVESYYLYSSYLFNILKSIKFIQMHHLYKLYKKKHNHKFLDLCYLKKETEMLVHKLYLYNQIIIYMFYIIVLFIGFYMYVSFKMSIGSIFMFYMLMTYCIPSLMSMIAMYGQYQHLCILYEKYKKYNNENTSQELKVCDCIKSICFDHIEYSYGYGIPIIEHLDWTIESSVLLIGENGCGKSTLLKLLLGYDYNYSGDIYINDIELRQLSLESLYQRLSYLNEKPVFINDTLYNNFLCDNTEQVENMLKRFHQQSLINMFDTYLDIEGTPLSLGQRQIVALIRELLFNKDVYIFDEAFSHMDEKIIQEVCRYLNETKHQCIYIIVNHQTNLMNMNFDCVIMSGKRISKG